MQRKSNKMNAYLFLFYATTVNIPMGQCHKIIHMGLIIYDVAKQTYIYFIF
jgi:hypothetical protein